MKAIVFFALLALACSYSHFRTLQTDTPPANNAIVADNSTNGTNSTNSTNATNATNDTNSSNSSNSSSGANASNSSNATNSSNSSGAASGEGVGDNESAPNGAANLTNSSSAISGIDFNQLFNATGTYVLVSSNCTILTYNLTNSNDGEADQEGVNATMANTTNSSLCFPQLMLQVDLANSLVNVSFVYPNNASCGNNSNQTINFTYPYANGIFMGQNATDDTFFDGVFFINNRSILSYANDTNNMSQVCWANWALNSSSNASSSSNSSNASNSTNGTNGTNSTGDNEAQNNEAQGVSGVGASDNEAAPTGAANLTNNNATNSSSVNWEGEWQVASYQITSSNMSNGTCCIPDSPILIHQDNTTNSIFYMYRTPNCPECGANAGYVAMHNVSVVGGAGSEENLAVPTYIYNVNNTILYVTPSCYIAFEPVAPVPCNSTSNATNSSSGSM